MGISGPEDDESSPFRNIRFGADLNMGVEIETLKTGTTTVGIKTKDGVILASERRATMGHIIAHTQVQKVFPISDNIGMTIAGLVGDAQLMVRFLQSEVAVHSMKRGAPMTVNAAATLVSNVIRQGFYLGLIIGGYDQRGGHVFSIDGAGGCIEDNYVSVGSGSLFALGVLEGQYKEDMTESEGVDLAISALNSAIRRDSASGDGMLISVIDRDGTKSISEEKIRTRAAELGFRYPN
jgi:proteasome beta subunit